MPDVPDLLRSALVDLPHQPRLQKVWIAAVDLAPHENNPPWADPSGPNSIAFQYWPESLTDSRTVEWNPRVIPGGSHPIYQWTHSGERRISFIAVFTTDTEPSESSLRNRNPYEESFDNLLSGVQRGTRDIDIRAAVSWLRWFTYPTYGQGEDTRVFEPAKVLLCMPNTGIAHTGEDHITAVMTDCTVTYEACFTSGFPRICEVSIELAEVVQRGSSVRFHDRTEMNPAKIMGHFTGLDR